MADLKSDFDGLHKAILGKIGEYDKNLVNIGTDIKAMEKVFQKVIPILTLRPIRSYLPRHCPDCECSQDKYEKHT